MRPPLECDSGESSQKVTYHGKMDPKFKVTPFCFYSPILQVMRGIKYMERGHNPIQHDSPRLNKKAARCQIFLEKSPRLAQSLIKRILNFGRVKDGSGVRFRSRKPHQPPSCTWIRCPFGSAFAQQ